MDIKQELSELAGDQRRYPDSTSQNRARIAETARAEIERLEKYAQHTPSCALVLFRAQSFHWKFVPPLPPCSCGLISAQPKGEDS